jgi:hypothetical protein
MLFTPVVIVLVAKSIVGTNAIPFGDAQFLDRAVALELSFIMITVLTYKGFHKALYTCIPKAIQHISTKTFIIIIRRLIQSMNIH